MFTDKMQSPLSYARAFEEDYGVRSVDVRILDIEEDMMSSRFLAANFRAT